MQALILELPLGCRINQLGKTRQPLFTFIKEAVLEMVGLNIRKPQHQGTAQTKK